MYIHKKVNEVLPRISFMQNKGLGQTSGFWALRGRYTQSATVIRLPPARTTGPTPTNLHRHPIAHDPRPKQTCIKVGRHIRRDAIASVSKPRMPQGDPHLTVTARLSWTDVRDEIRARILSRTFAPGDRLPRDEDIAAELGVARSTVHRAMQDLSLAGLVERKRKGGTHVKTDPVTRATFDIPITRREVEQQGRKYGYQLISRELADSPMSVMARFGIQRPVEMLHVKALHLADNRPYLLEDRWIDTRSTPEILDVDLTQESANEWLVRFKPYSRIDIRFYAMNATGDTAQHLSAPVGSALLVIERTTWIGTDPITSVQAVAMPGYQLAARN